MTAQAATNESAKPQAEQRPAAEAAQGAQRPAEVRVDRASDARRAYESSVESRRGKLGETEAKLQAAQETIDRLVGLMERQTAMLEARMTQSTGLVEGALSRLKDDQRDAALKNFTAETLALMNQAKASQAEKTQRMGGLIVVEGYRARSAKEHGELKAIEKESAEFIQKKREEDAAARAELEKKATEERTAAEAEKKKKEAEAAREAEMKKPKRDTAGVMRELLKAREVLFAAQSLERELGAKPGSAEQAKIRDTVKAAEAAFNAKFEEYTKANNGEPASYDDLNAKLSPEKVQQARREIEGAKLELPPLAREYGPKDLIRQAITFREMLFAADGLSKSGTPEAAQVGFVAASEAKKQLENVLLAYKQETGQQLDYAYLNEVVRHTPDVEKVAREQAEKLTEAVRADAYVKKVDAAGALFQEMRRAGGKAKAPELYQKWMDARADVEKAFAALTGTQQETMKQWRGGEAPPEIKHALGNYVTSVRELSITKPIDLAVLPDHLKPAKPEPTPAVVEAEPDVDAMSDRLTQVLNRQAKLREEIQTYYREHATSPVHEELAELTAEEKNLRGELEKQGLTPVEIDGRSRPKIVMPEAESASNMIERQILETSSLNGLQIQRGMVQERIRGLEDLLAAANARGEAPSEVTVNALAGERRFLAQLETAIAEKQPAAPSAAQERPKIVMPPPPTPEAPRPAAEDVPEREPDADSVKVFSDLLAAASLEEVKGTTIPRIEFELQQLEQSLDVALTRGEGTSPEDIRALIGRAKWELGAAKKALEAKQKEADEAAKIAAEEAEALAKKKAEDEAAQKAADAEAEALAKKEAAKKARAERRAQLKAEAEAAAAAADAEKQARAAKRAEKKAAKAAAAPSAPPPAESTPPGAEQETVEITAEIAADIALVGNEKALRPSAEDTAAAREALKAWLPDWDSAAVSREQDLKNSQERNRLVRGWSELTRAHGTDGKTIVESGDFDSDVDYFHSAEAARAESLNFLAEVGISSSEGWQFADVLMPVRFNEQGQPVLALERVSTQGRGTFQEAKLVLDEAKMAAYLKWVNRTGPSNRTQAREKILTKYLIPTLEARVSTTKDERQRQRLDKQLALLRDEARLVNAPADWSQDSGASPEAAGPEKKKLRSFEAKRPASWAEQAKIDKAITAMSDAQLASERDQVANEIKNITEFLTNPGGMNEAIRAAYEGEDPAELEARVSNLMWREQLIQKAIDKKAEGSKAA